MGVQDTIPGPVAALKASWKGPTPSPVEQLLGQRIAWAAYQWRRPIRTTATSTPARPPRPRPGGRPGQRGPAPWHNPARPTLRQERPASRQHVRLIPSYGAVAWPVEVVSP